MNNKALIASFLSIGLTACGGGSSPDPVKPGSSTDNTQTPNKTSLAGKAIDGYLAHAKACLDFNKNYNCDGSDEYETVTDEKGNYSLSVPNGFSTNAAILVKAIANVTIDLDKPDQFVSKPFYLLANFSRPEVVSPVSTMVQVKLDKYGDLAKAEQEVMSHLGFEDKSLLYVDFVKESKREDLGKEDKKKYRKVRTVNRVIANVMAEGLERSEKQSSGQSDKTKMTKMFLDKFATSALPIVNEQVDTAIAKAGDSEQDVSTEEIAKNVMESAPDIAVTDEEVEQGKAKPIVPVAPSSAQIDDAKNTFGWINVAGYSDLSDYEFSVDGGSSWQTVSANPIQLSDQVYAINAIQVRIAANEANNRQAGSILTNAQAYSVTPSKPSSPTAGRVDDGANTFGWSNATGFSNASDYEYSTDAGNTWSIALNNPVQLSDNAYAVGDVQVRVKADVTTGRPASDSLISSQAYTVTPAQPVAPTNPIVNDVADLFGWTNVTGFSSASDYEYSIDAGSNWRSVSSNPIALQNLVYRVGVVQVRVKAGANNGRPAGAVLSNPQAYTVALPIPAAPTGGIVNDAANTFAWNNVSGFTQVSDYEYSTDGGSNWSIASSNPLQLANQDFAVGRIQVRVKATATNRAGNVLTNQQAYTGVKKPSAPTSGVVNDTTNTFNWTNVSGFNQVSDYEYSTDSGSSWSNLTAKPLQLENKAYAVGMVQVRVKATNVRPAGDALSNQQAYTGSAPAPAAPTNGVVNDSANTFGWTNTPGFTNASDYEFSTNSGSTWSNVSNNPIQLANQAYAVGVVQVRVKADRSNNRPAGNVLSNDQAFTVPVAPTPPPPPPTPPTPSTPAAPTNPVVNDAINTFDWTFSSGYASNSHYQYSVDSGANWNNVSAKPIQLQDIVYASGVIQVRVKANAVSNNPVGNVLSSDKAYTVTPDKPATPSAAVIDDINNTFNWTNSSGFGQTSDYEYSVDAGNNWQDVTKKPIQLENKIYALEQVQVRVKENTVNGRPASDALKNNNAYTKGLDAPAAPTNGVVNDTYNTDTFSWTAVPTFTKLSDYEISKDGGNTYTGLTGNASVLTYTVGNVNLAKGKLLVRVKQDTSSGRPAGATLANAVAFTKYDANISAPVYTANDTYGQDYVAFTPVAGYSSYSLYEYSLDGGSNWQDATAVRITIGNIALSANQVKIRVKAKANSNAAGAIASVTQAFTKTAVPAAPVILAESDRFNTLVWQKVAGIDNVSDYEVKIVDADWITATSTTIQLEDKAYAIGSIKVRVKEKVSSQRPAGTIAANTTPYTVTPAQPDAPTINVQDDDNNQFGWTNVASYTSLSDYEVKINSADWTTATANPTIVGNVAINIGGVKVRVKASSADGRPAGKEAVSTRAYTQSNSALLAALTAQQSNITSITQGISAYNTEVSGLSSLQGTALRTKAKAVAEKAALLKGLLALANTTKATLVKAITDNSSDTAANKATVQAAVDSLTANISTLTTLIGNVPNTLKTAFNNASTGSGAVVISQANAMIASSRFAKLDWAGHFIETATAVNQGWRCLLDTKVRTRTVWALLQDGAKGGSDDLLFAVANGTGNTDQRGIYNNESICGITNWQLPTKEQLATLKPTTVSDFAKLDQQGNTLSDSSSDNYYWYDKANKRLWTAHRNRPDSEKVNFTAAKALSGLPASIANIGNVTWQLPSEANWQALFSDAKAAPFLTSLGTASSASDLRNIYWVNKENNGNGAYAINVSGSGWSISNAGNGYTVFVIASAQLTNAQALTAQANINNTNAFTKHKGNEVSFNSASNRYYYWSSSKDSSNDPIAVSYATGSQAYAENAISDSSAKAQSRFIALSKPAAPTNPVQNDTADTFDWTYTPNFTQANEYEYSKDGGSSWNNVTVKPVQVGDEALDSGKVQVRVKATSMSPASDALSSTAAYAKATCVVGSTGAAEAKIYDGRCFMRFDNSARWETAAASCPVNMALVSRGYSKISTMMDELGLRKSFGYKYWLREQRDQNTAYEIDAGRVGDWYWTYKTNTRRYVCVELTEAETAGPVAPTLPVENDKADTFGWTNVAGYSSSADYQFSIDGGSSWNDVSGNPTQVGNKNVSVGDVQVRAKAKGFRKAGQVLVSTKAYTKVPDAPTNPTHDDAANTFGWTNVSGYTNPSQYEYSVDNGSNWSDVTANPQTVGDVSLVVGHVQVRVKTNNDEALILKSTQRFTKTPVVAPTSPTHDDTANTFGWTNVASYTTPSQYEYSVDNGSNWRDATSNPQNIGELTLAIGHVQVRVKTVDNNALVLKSTQAYTAPCAIGNTGANLAKSFDGKCFLRYDSGKNKTDATNTCAAHGFALVSKDYGLLTQLGTQLSLSTSNQYRLKEQNNSWRSYLLRYLGGWRTSVNRDSYSYPFICVK